MNVYQAAEKRLDLIFDEFDNIYVSFSGGKDSGVLVNMAIDKARVRGRKITILYVDLEAMYSETIKFVEQIMLNNADVVIPHWVCLPLLTTNSVSMYEPFWIFWDKLKQDGWVRSMPNYDFVINEGNCNFPFFYPNMTFEEFMKDYSQWQSSFGKTACLIGIRSDESLNRWRATHNNNVSRYKGEWCSVEISQLCYNFYPLYDWKVDDIWTYNGKFKKPYNKVYNLMYNAGVPLSKQRICEPYGDEQKAGLNMFKLIEPSIWNKLIDRVSGANFGNIYCNTKAIGAKNIKLPKEHTWRSYCKFLLNTLPINTANIYREKFFKFIQYWRKNGCPLDNELIEKIRDNNNVMITDSFSNRGSGNKFVVKFRSIPDTIDGDNETDMLSWKRMCMAIVKNDITCQTLSFSITKKQLEKRNETFEKYKSLSK